VTSQAKAALQKLKAGNTRFAQGCPAHRFAAEERRDPTEGQRPYAIVIGCSDSRVPVEAVFDAGVGELFVVRTAGHTLAQASLASTRFAIERLGTRLVLVLGHEDCGAVSAALAGDAPEWLRPITDQIDVSSADPARAPADAENRLLAAAVDDHVRETRAALRAFIDEFAPDVEVLGAAYKLDSGKVHWLED
jgi:carbonic anhydrase